MSAAESPPLGDARSAQSPTRRRRRDRPETQRAAASRVYAVGRRHSNGFSMHLLVLISTSYPSVEVSGGRSERWAETKRPPYCGGRVGCECQLSLLRASRPRDWIEPEVIGRGEVEVGHEAYYRTGGRTGQGGVEGKRRSSEAERTAEGGP